MRQLEDAQREAVTGAWAKVSENMLEFGQLVFHRLFEVAPGLLSLFSFGDDEQARCFVR